MTLRIETIPGHQRTMVKLIGRIQREHLSELRAQLDAIGSESCDIIDDEDENQFANGQRSRDLRGRSDANGEFAQTKSDRAGDLKIMNLVILIDSAQMFFRNFGLRHVNAALGLAIGLAAPNARQKMIARFARPVEWLRSRLRPQGPKTSIRVQSSEAIGTADAGGEMNAGDRVRIFHSGEIGKVEQVGGGFVVVLLDKPRADGAERVRILNKGVAVAAIRASASEIRKTCGMVAIAAPPAGSRNVNKGAIALSAYATRKTAQVTTQILLTSQRPYIGTESVNLIRETNPKVSVELRNFGSVQAEDAVITIVLRMNRQALCSDSEPQ